MPRKMNEARHPLDGVKRASEKCSVLTGRNVSENSTTAPKSKPAHSPIHHRRAAVSLLRMAGGADDAGDRQALMMEAHIRLSLARSMMGRAAYV